MNRDNSRLLNREHDRRRGARSLLPFLLATLLVACDHGEPPQKSEVEQRLQDTGRLIESGDQRQWSMQSAKAGWETIPATGLILYPQRSVEPGLDEATTGPIEARLQAWIDGERLLLRVEWPDASEDRYRRDATARFADALAVQFDPADKPRLPYIGMGEPQRPVKLWFWRADQEAEALEARGFGRLEPDPGAEAPTVIDARRHASGWTVILAGPLPSTSNPLPVSLAIWDGAEAGRDGRKRLSAWHLLRTPASEPDKRRLEALAEAAAQTGGDPERGQRLVQEHGCTGCHALPPGQSGSGSEVPPSLGPDLSYAGGIHWPGYLRRAIDDPSAFIVPGEAYHRRNHDGERRSLMPEPELSRQELADMVAFLSQNP